MNFFLVVISLTQLVTDVEHIDDSHWDAKYRITAILKVETHTIANISASPKVQGGIFVIMSVFRTDVIVFIDDVIMCFTSD